MTCNTVVFFYEHHQDFMPARVIRALTPTLKNAGIKAYCFEEPSDESKADIMQLMTDQTVQLAVKVTSFEHQYVQNMLRLMRSYDPQTGDMQQINPATLSENDKQSIIDLVNSHNEDMKKSFEETLALMHETDSSELEYCNIDLPRTERTPTDQQYSTISTDINTLLNDKNFVRRDNYLKNNILEKCDHYGGSIMVLIGASHFGVANLIKQETNADIKVKEYYVIDVPYNPAEPGDICLRPMPDMTPESGCNIASFDGMVVDLADNSNQDPIELIGDHIVEWSTASYHDEI